MNVQTNSMPADERASMTHSRAIFGLDRLRATKPRDLHNLMETLFTVSSVLGGFLGQPRYFDDETHEYVGGGKMLDELTEMVNQALDDIRMVSREAKATTQEDAEYSAWIEIIGHAVYGDDLLTVAHVALNGVDAMRSIKQEEAEGRFHRKAVAA